MYDTIKYITSEEGTEIDVRRINGETVQDGAIFSRIKINATNVGCRELALREYQPPEPIRIMLYFTAIKFPQHLVNSMKNVPLINEYTEDFLYYHFFRGQNKADIKETIKEVIHNEPSKSCPPSQTDILKEVVIPGHDNKYIAMHNILIVRTAMFYNALKALYQEACCKFPFDRLTDYAASNIYYLFEDSIEHFEYLLCEYGERFDIEIPIIGYKAFKDNVPLPKEELFNVVTKKSRVYQFYKSLVSMDLPYEELFPILNDPKNIIYKDDKYVIRKVKINEIFKDYEEESCAYFKHHVNANIFGIIYGLYEIKVKNGDHTIVWEKHKSLIGSPCPELKETGVIAIYRLIENL